MAPTTRRSRQTQNNSNTQLWTTESTRQPLQTITATPITPSRHGRGRVAASSPATPTTTIPLPCLRLDLLPTDILYRIAQLTEPAHTVYETEVGRSGSGALRSSDDWVDAGRDLLRLSLTCKTVHRAVGSRLRRFWGFVVAMTPRQRGVGAAGEGDEGIREGDLYAAARSVDNHYPSPSSLTPTAGAQVRHLHVHELVGEGSGSMIALPSSKQVPLLETFAYVNRSREEVLLGNEWALGRIMPTIFYNLAVCCPELRELYISGGDVHYTGSSIWYGEREWEFGPKMQGMTLVVSGDELCRLISRAKYLKRIVVWREFTKVPEPGTEEWWWKQDVWKTIQEVDLRGFSGNNGRPMLQAAFAKLKALRTSSPELPIPLQCLRLPEAHQMDTLTTHILPAISELSSLKTFSFLVYRSRSFKASFVGTVASALPQLEELAIGVESESLHWWAASLTEFAAEFAKFSDLETLTWNHTPYSDIDYDAISSRSYLLNSATRIASACPKLTTIRWFEQAAHLKKRDGRWYWSDRERFPIKERIRFFHEEIVANGGDLSSCSSSSSKNRPQEPERKRLGPTSTNTDPLGGRGGGSGVFVGGAGGTGDDSGYFEAAHEFGRSPPSSSDGSLDDDEQN
ncbi:hypothetical protein T439DRAFT_382648 [Meredithblackwellia eburnea MCA 4105]